MPQEDTDNIKKAIAAIDARKESLKPFRKSSHNKYVKSPYSQMPNFLSLKKSYISAPE